MKNLGRYNEDLSVPRKKDVDEKQEKIPVTEEDNGKFMRVVNGVWAAAEVANANGESF